MQNSSLSLSLMGDDRARKDTAQSSLPSASIPPPVHQSDADEDDENVKQLGDCSALYLALQVISPSMDSSSSPPLSA